MHQRFLSAGAALSVFLFAPAAFGQNAVATFFNNDVPFAWKLSASTEVPASGNLDSSATYGNAYKLEGNWYSGPDNDMFAQVVSSAYIYEDPSTGVISYRAMFESTSGYEVQQLDTAATDAMGANVTLLITLDSSKRARVIIGTPHGVKQSTLVPTPHLWFTSHNVRVISDPCNSADQWHEFDDVQYMESGVSYWQSWLATETQSAVFDHSSGACIVEGAVQDTVASGTPGKLFTGYIP